MATISNESILKQMNEKKSVKTYSLGNTGILHPIMENRWRIIFDSLIYGGDVSVLAMQAIRCDFDFVNRLLTVEIEQSLSGDEHVELLGLCTRGNHRSQPRFTVRVDLLNGNNDIQHSMVCLMSKVKSHKFALDYSKSHIAKHELVIKFHDLQIMEPKKETQS